MSITLRPRNQADSADFLLDVKSPDELGDYIKEHEPNRMYSKVHTKPSLER